MKVDSSEQYFRNSIKDTNKMIEINYNLKKERIKLVDK